VIGWARISNAVAQLPKKGGWKKDGVLEKRESLGHFGVPGPGFFAVVDGKFAVYIVYMGLYGAEFDELGGSDFFVGFAFGEHAKDQEFFGCEDGQEVLYGLGYVRGCREIGQGLLRDSQGRMGQTGLARSIFG